jgi:hypothetical protein
MCDLPPRFSAAVSAAAPAPVNPLSLPPDPGAGPFTTPLPGLVEPTAPAPAAAARPNGRPRLWELPRKYHCPVIGTCLTVAELRELARKAGRGSVGPLTDYELHVSFVAAATERNILSLAAHKALERKFAATVRRFAAAADPAALLTRWQQALARGEVPAAFWALMTHARADEDLRGRAYEDVHMLSHQIGAGLAADLKALAEARATLVEERRVQARAMARASARQTEQATELATLRGRLAELAGLQPALAAARARIAALEDDTLVRDLTDRVAELEAALADCLQRGAASEERQAALRAEVAALRAERASLAGRLVEQEAACALLEQALLVTDGDAGCCGDGDCASCARRERGLAGLDLRGLRILCVGGRGSLTARWRDLVARCNGELVRHDGGLEDSRARLHALLASVDVVVCPLDQVSHDACLRAKRHCKQAGKPCLLLERSGLGNFAHALARVAGDLPAGTARVTGPASG